MTYRVGFLKGNHMLADNKLKIEKIHLLKLASLSKPDQKWIIKKLKKQNKPAYKNIIDRISEVRKFDLSFDDFRDIYDELNFNQLFEKNEIEQRIDSLNLLPSSKFDHFLKSLSYSDLILFIYCDDFLDIKKVIVNKIKISSDYVADKIELKVNKNEKISDCLINYLFENLIEGQE